MLVLVDRTSADVARFELFCWLWQKLTSLDASWRNLIIQMQTITFFVLAKHILYKWFISEQIWVEKGIIHRRRLHHPLSCCAVPPRLHLEIQTCAYLPITVKILRPWLADCLSWRLQFTTEILFYQVRETLGASFSYIFLPSYACYSYRCAVRAILQF